MWDITLWFTQYTPNWDRLINHHQGLLATVFEDLHFIIQRDFQGLFRILQRVRGPETNLTVQIPRIFVKHSGSTKEEREGGTRVTQGWRRDEKKQGRMQGWEDGRKKERINGRREEGRKNSDSAVILLVPVLLRMWQSHQIHSHAFAHPDKSQHHLLPENISITLHSHLFLRSQLLNTKMQQSYYQLMSCYVP